MSRKITIMIDRGVMKEDRDVFIHSKFFRNQRRLPAYSFNSRMKLKDYDLNRIVGDLEEMLPGILPEGIEVIFDIADSELKIMTDPLKLRGALLNLIENARDALLPGGSLTLSTSRIQFSNGTDCSSTYASGGCALVSISDTGTGMSEIIREKMFEPFFTTKPGNDKGLGCTLAQRIVDCHNGRISVDSSINKGTTVRIYLPLLKTDRTQEIPIPLPSSLSMKAARLSA